jgi:hypothetical protein
MHLTRTMVQLLLVLCLIASAPVGVLAQRASERRVANPGETQFDVQLLRPSGGPVVPIFEGWYRNADGTFELSFGFFNVNTEETIEVPLGPDNFIEPAVFDGRQPTRFEPVPDQDRRHFGAFTVNVPADFGEGDVVWTIRSAGQTLSVPGRLTHVSYELAGSDFPGRTTVSPMVRLAEDGPFGRGPSGITGAPLQARVGDAVDVGAWVARDVESGEDDRPINIKWFKHQGPGEVTFDERTTSVEQLAWAAGEVKVATTVTFSEPGDYLLRMLVFNVTREFEFQCCWTNGYLPVTVAP